MLRKIKNTNGFKFARNAAPVFLTKLSGVFISFLLALLLARLLGPSGFGVYTYFLAIANIVVVVLCFGFPTVALKSTASAKTSIQRNSVVHLMVFATIVIVVGGVLALVMVNVVVREDVQLWVLSIIYSVSSALMILWNKFLEGQNRVLLGQIQQTLTSRVLFVIFIVLPVILNSDTNALDVPTALVGNASSLVLTLVASVYFSRKYLFQNFRLGNKQDVKGIEWIRRSSQFALLGVLLAGLDNLNIVMLKHIGNSEVEVAFYQVGYQMSFLASFGLMVANAIGAPRFAKNWADRDFEELNHNLYQTALFGAAICLFSTFFIVFAGHWIISIGFGTEYDGAYAPMVVLLFGQALGAMFGSTGSLLTMIGRERVAVKAILIAGILNIAFALLLVPDFGASGAAFSRAIAVLGSLVYMFRFVYWKLQINTSVFRFPVKT